MAFLLGIMLLPSLIGALLIWHVMRPQKSPADASNRINKIRLIWFAMTREEMFAPHFAWLRSDEAENMKPGDF
jgi:hypothetical protein